MDVQIATNKHSGIVMPVDLAGMDPGEYMNAIAAAQDGAIYMIADSDVKFGKK